MFPLSFFIWKFWHIVFINICSGSIIKLGVIWNYFFTDSTRLGPTLEPRRYKPIKVDNWGIFLLSRLQTYFQKKEYTDLTLRFPEKNAQIKVHKLVINACTDYFVKQEENGLMTDGVYDMPSCFLPELVAPIIRFMYTGRLDLKSQMFTR